MICPKCGAENSDSSAFCSLCLTRFADQQPESEQEAGRQDQDEAEALERLRVLQTQNLTVDDLHEMSTRRELGGGFGDKLLKVLTTKHLSSQRRRHRGR